MSDICRAADVAHFLIYASLFRRIGVSVKLGIMAAGWLFRPVSIIMKEA